MSKEHMVVGRVEKHVLEHLKREGNIGIHEIANYYSNPGLAVPLAQKFITYGIARLSKTAGVLEYIPEELPSFDEGKK